MRNSKSSTENIISQVPESLWKVELEKTSYRYHFIAAWAAIILNPVFSATDYFNIPESWEFLLVIRLTVSLITLSLVLISRNRKWPSFIIAGVPFMLISLENAYAYRLISDEHLLGHNLNYMALWIGASMFLMWGWTFSLAAIGISCSVAAFFVVLNPAIEARSFFVNGGLLLVVVALFMAILITARYNLSLKEIKARIALKLSSEEIEAQAGEIKRINENLEKLVENRTKELQRKNLALEEYAFINGHKLRAPVASILGLANLMKKIEMSEDARVIMNHIHDSTEKLDLIVRTITKAIEKADTKI